MPEIDVAFTHSADVRRKRKRNAETIRCLSTVRVAVPELSSSSAPLAFRCRIGLGDGPVDHRSHDGRFWKPMDAGPPDADGPDAQASLDAAWLAGRCSTVSGGGPIHAGRTPWWRETAIPLGERDDVAEVLSDDREHVARAVADEAADLALIDGRLWVATPEPVLCLHWSGGEPWLQAETPSWLGPGTFRLDQADLPGLLDPRLADRLAGEPGDVEVLRPDLLRRDVSGHVLADTADAVLDTMAHVVLKADVGFFASYAALRDGASALHEALDAPVAPDPGPVLDAVRDALSALAGRGIPADDHGRRLGRCLARYAYERGDPAPSPGP